METSLRHKQDVLASNLLLGLLALSYGWADIEKYVLHRVSLLDMRADVVVGTILVEACAYYFIRKGKLWAKLLFVLLFAIMLIGPALDYKRLLPFLAHDPIGLVKYFITYAVQVWAAALMFRNRRVQPQQV